MCLRTPSLTSCTMYGGSPAPGSGMARSQAGMRDAPDYFGRRTTPAQERPSAVQKSSAGLGESMFSSGSSSSAGSLQSHWNTRQESDSDTMRNNHMQNVNSNEMQGHSFNSPARTSSLVNYDDRMGSSSYAGRHEGMGFGEDLALVRNAEGEDEEMLMPPSNSLLSGMPATPQNSGNDMMDDDEMSGSNTTMRRRPAARTPGAGGVGLDLDAPRGLDLSSPMVLSGRSREGMNLNGGRSSAWVTVFGYPTGAGFAVLRHFQTYGEVHEHRNEAGNWMHILYSSRVQASRALAHNGSFIQIGDTQVMIGVKACNDPSFASFAASASTQGMTSTDFTHQAKQSYRVRDPEQLQRAPNRAMSMCKRFWSWVLDV